MNTRATTKILQSKAVFQKLEELIVITQLKPGFIYSEKELMDLIECGRTPLREALQRLEVTGLVIIKPKKGIQITDISVDKQLELLQMRRPIQNFIAEYVAEHITQSSKACIFEFIENTKKELNNPSFSKLDALNVARQAHEVLLESCNNEFAVKTLQMVQTFSRRFWVYHVTPSDCHIAIELQISLLLEIAEGNVQQSIIASNKLVDYLEMFTKSKNTW